MPQHPSGSARRRLVLGLILLLALGLRLGWGLSRDAGDKSLDALPDQREYLTLADNLIHGRGFQFVDRRFDDTVYAFRTPGYPLFLAACGVNIRVIRAAQAAVDTSTVLAVYLLTGLLMRRREVASAVAAVLVSFNPFLIYFTGLILSETLFTAMLAWAMVLLILGNAQLKGTRRSAVLWLAGGLLLSVSTLVRPSAAPLAVLLGYGACFVNRTTGSAYQRRWPFPVGATMLLLVGVVLLLWGYRNWRVLGHWVWLDTNAGITLYDGYNPGATGASDQSFVSQMPQLRLMNELQRSQYLAAKAREYAQSHPKRVMDLAAAKLARTWSPVPLGSENRRARHLLIGLCYGVPFDMLIVVGLAVGSLPRAAKVFLLLPAIYITAVHALTVGSLRYRMPVEPPMAIIAASTASLLAASQPPWRRFRGPWVNDSILPPPSSSGPGEA